MQPKPHPQPSGCEPRAGHPGTPRVLSAPSVPPALPKLEGQRPLPGHPGRKGGPLSRQKMPRASQPPPLEEPTAFSDPPWAPLPPKAVVTLGMQHLPRMNFSFCFLSAYTSYRPLGPARESACALPSLPNPAPGPWGGWPWWLPLTRVPGFRRQNNCRGEHAGCRSPLCCCFTGVSADGVPVLVPETV